MSLKIIPLPWRLSGIPVCWLCPGLSAGIATHPATVRCNLNWSFLFPDSLLLPPPLIFSACQSSFKNIWLIMIFIVNIFDSFALYTGFHEKFQLLHGETFCSLPYVILYSVLFVHQALPASFHVGEDNEQRSWTGCASLGPSPCWPYCPLPSEALADYGDWVFTSTTSALLFEISPGLCLLTFWLWNSRSECSSVYNQKTAYRKVPYEKHCWIN